MGGSDQRNRTVDGVGEVKLFISARDVRSSANSGLKSDISPCPFGANNGSRQYECKGRRLAPPIEISLLEWMSGILSKVRILPDD